MATEIEPKPEILSQELEVKEKKIPVFSVVKNNSILKNIFLINTPPPLPTSSSPSCFASEENNRINQEELEEILVVGRHPDCNITLEHPSISRFHLRIHSNPSIQSLSVLDWSSVHGTWVSGKKIEPGIRVKLLEGDTLRLGGSSRVYRLHWVPLSRAFDMKNPFVPPLDESVPVEESAEETHPHENEFVSYFQDDQTETPDDYFESLDLLFADTNMTSSMKQLTTSPPLMPEDMKSPFPFVEDAEKKIPFGEALLQSKIDKMQTDWQVDKENCTLQVNFTSEVPERFSQAEDPESPIATSQKRSGVSIWKRRGKSASVHIQTGRARENCTKADSGLEMESEGNENIRTGLVSEDQFAAADCVEEEIFTPDKENCTPDTFSNRPSKEIAQEKMKCEFSVNYLVSSMDKEDEEIFTPDKENKTPRTHLLRSMKKMGKVEEINHPKTYRSSPLKNAGSFIRGESDMLILSDNRTELSKLHQEEKSANPASNSLARSEADLLNCKFNMNYLVSSMDEKDEVEAFTPDKENRTPRTHLRWSMKKMGKFEEINRPKTYRSSPLKNADSITHGESDMLILSNNRNELSKLLQEKKSANPASNSLARPETELFNAREDRVPFQSLLVKSCKAKSEALDLEGTTTSCKSVKNTQIKEAIHPFHSFSKDENKTWIMVVDTACLLNKESRKALDLMQGLQRTSLIIPRIVIRELDCMKRHNTLFRSTTGVHSALQWIEDCMVNAKGWVHVQSSVEDARTIAPTPRALPLSQFGEEKEKFSFGSVPLSPCGSLLEIVSPTTEDHILECALFFRKITNNGQVVLLSDDVTLKIKSMAEGLRCETAEEFRESLVNPFSERFLWIDSSARGPTWSCLDDVVLWENYYDSTSRKQSKIGEVAKGLKLVLLHNSQYRQISSVS
ncbi:hypothetical protein ACH5RR_033791 [Cinchona calisaya]|uniref:FHA domain-containing protein n=1 Tax=Cinchona calisaya TaxID=153742 RepID=A0ABD2YDN2_9GENT